MRCFVNACLRFVVLLSAVAQLQKRSFCKLQQVQIKKGITNRATKVFVNSERDDAKVRDEKEKETWQIFTKSGALFVNNPNILFFFLCFFYSFFFIRLISF